MTTRRLRIPPRWRSLLPFAGIAMVVGGLAGAFAWTAGWLTPARVTAPRLVDAIETGKPYAGFRRAHARGVRAGWRAWGNEAVATYAPTWPTYARAGDRSGAASEGD